MIALACGACNCTNLVPGLPEVFRAGQHVITYEPETLCDRIEELLSNHELREGVAAEGCKEVLYRHTWLPEAVPLPSIPLTTQD